MTDQPPELEISCNEVRALREAAEDCFLVDCRERDEHELVHIDGATLLPMSEISTRVAELTPHKQRRVIVHCHHGGRSLRVAEWLRQQGFTGAQSMSGGIDQWAAEIEPGMARY